MPNITPYFGLQYFLLGDLYSASIDRSRFMALDSYLSFIADIIGDGVIDGWNLIPNNNLILEIKPGWGMINGKIVQTYGSYYKTLSDNTNYYVWMRQRFGVVSEVSAFSNIAILTHQQTDSIEQPNNLQITKTTFNSVTLNWNKIITDEIIFYEIYRSVDNINFQKINRVFENQYSDNNLKENTIYYYKIRATNKILFSAFTSSVIAATAKNLRQPANVSDIQIRPSSKILHLTWDLSLSNHVQSIEISYAPVSALQVAIGDEKKIIVDANANNISISDLFNDQLYRVTVLTRSFAGVASQSVVRYVAPVYNDGPDDITSISVFDFKASNSYGNVLNIIWNTYEDPYLAFDGRTEIILEEVRGTTTIRSLPLVVDYDIGTTNIQIFGYADGLQRLYKNIEARTDYFITVRNIAINGKKSTGKRIKFRTRNFKPPESPKNLTISRRIVDDQLTTESIELVARWNNSASPFSNNFITVRKTKANITETIFENINIDIANQYIIPASYVENNSTYTVLVKCQDEFANESKTISADYAFILDSIIDRPTEPSFAVTSGNKQTVVTWTLPKEEVIKSVKIYRAAYGSIENPNIDYALIATVPADSHLFIDYDVQNDIIYSYFVSTVNESGLESVNIVNTAGVAQIFVRSRPTNNSRFLTPKNVSVTKIANNVEIIWEATGGIFDGYEIFRSIGNKYSFESIANVSASTTYFVDTNVLNRTKDIYYMIRKYKNQSEPFLVIGATLIADAVLLGTVSTVNGVIKIDEEPARIIKNLQDPITAETYKEIVRHKHDFVFVDRRIDLNPQIEIISWQTNDNQTFYTSEDISMADEYVLFIGGLNVVETGLLYVVDKEKGTITFETKLCPIGNEVEAQTFPYSTLPSIAFIINNLQEVQNLLEPSQIVGISAAQINSGIFDKAQINVINHRGRINEKLIPQQLLLKTVDDGYRFTFNNNTELFGSATVFYDIIGINNDNILLASTSTGILKSNNFGQTWEIVTQFTTPASKLLYVPKFNRVVAATNSGVYTSTINQNLQFQAWAEVFGTENTKIVRDFTIDDAGDLYCSSDLGVYKLRQVVNSENFYFEQLPLLGPLSTDCYAIIYDNQNKRLLVSNQFGTFESYDNGDFWFFTNELTEQDPIYMFLQNNNSIFAITNNTLYRKNKTDNVFEKLVDFNAVDISRKVAIFKDRIYILTNLGVLVSDSKNNIYQDKNIILDFAFIDIKLLNKKLPIHTINTVNDTMLIGAESCLYISKNGRSAALQYQEENTICPTIYINGVEQIIGYRFSSTSNVYNKFACFDIKNNVDDVVTVANQYQIYEAQFGGWVDCDYKAPLTLKIGNQIVAKIAVAEKPATLLGSIQYPNINDRNSNLLTYEKGKILFESELTKLLEEEKNENDEFVAFKNFTNTQVSITYRQFELMRSQIYENARYILGTNENQEQIQIPFVFPSMNVVLLSDPNDESQSLMKNIVGSFGTYQEQAGAISATGNGSFSTELTSEGVDVVYLDNVEQYESSKKQSLNKVARKYPTKNIGWKGYQPAFCNAVRETFPIDYSVFNVVGIVNSVDGVLQIKTPITKYHDLTIDIENVTLKNTSLPHSVIEDSFELLNSGMPSHLSQVHDVNIVSAGCVQEYMMSGTMAQLCPPKQAKYIVPNNNDFYDDFASTINNNDLYVNENLNVSCTHAQVVFYDQNENSLFVGSYAGCFKINCSTLNISIIKFDAEMKPNVRDIKNIDNEIHALSDEYIYRYDRTAQKFIKKIFGNLPQNLRAFTYAANKNICLGTDDGIYVCRYNTKQFIKVIDTLEVDYFYAPDSVFAVLANNEIYSSTNANSWKSIATNKLNISKILKYKANSIFATDKGLYSDNTTINGQSLNLQLMDIFKNVNLSSSIAINDVFSYSDKLYACTSDGRLLIYDGSYKINQTVFNNLHKIFVVSDNIYLFNGNYFILFGENKIRKLASGVLI